MVVGGEGGGEATVGIMNMALININLAVAMSFKVNENKCWVHYHQQPMHAMGLTVGYALTRHPEERSDRIKSHLVRVEVVHENFNDPTKEWAVQPTVSQR